MAPPEDPDPHLASPVRQVAGVPGFHGTVWLEPLDLPSQSHSVARARLASPRMRALLRVRPALAKNTPGRTCYQTRG